MKHELKITLFLIGLFLMAQICGLAILKNTIVESTTDEGVKVVEFDEEKVGEVPEVSGSEFLIYVGIGIAIGTALVMLLAKFRKVMVWRIWFAVAVYIAIEYALKTFLSPTLSMVIALILTAWKIFRPNVLVHNLSEVLMYSGIAVFLVPLLNSVQNESMLGLPGNVFWAAMILVIISIYDFIAVFKSKHMVSMAKFQTESKVFAGLYIPYKARAEEIVVPAPIRKVTLKTSKSAAKTFKASATTPVLERREAILGGGDIAFPMIFSGTVMFYLASLMPVEEAFMRTCIIAITTTIALALLFFYAEKGKFYPAMPIVTAGCFVGYALTLLI